MFDNKLKLILFLCSLVFIDNSALVKTGFLTFESPRKNSNPYAGKTVKELKKIDPALKKALDQSWWYLRFLHSADERIANVSKNIEIINDKVQILKNCLKELKSNVRHCEFHITSEEESIRITENSIKELEDVIDDLKQLVKNIN